MTLYGGVEGGGTKFVCLVGSSPQDLRAEVRFPTTTPEETLGRVVAFFKRQGGGLVALGVGSFGPLDLDTASPTYGFITATPKPGWSQTDVANFLQTRLDLPVAFDTDVNAAAYGEFTWGAARGLDPCLYLTVGTGIGGGGIFNGVPMHGLVHPEMGHIGLPHDREKDPFPGVCPFHADCFEGLASGGAMKARWGAPAETLPADHPAWELEAGYIAQALANLICTLSPRRIVLGGGVLQQPVLLPLIRQKVLAALNGYVHAPQILRGIDQYIVTPGLGARAGVLGALALARSLVPTG